MVKDGERSFAKEVFDRNNKNGGKIIEESLVDKYKEDLTLFLASNAIYNIEESDKSLITQETNKGFKLTINEYTQIINNLKEVIAFLTKTYEILNNAVRREKDDFKILFLKEKTSKYKAEFSKNFTILDQNNIGDISLMMSFEEYNKYIHDKILIIQEELKKIEKGNKHITSKNITDLLAKNEQLFLDDNVTNLPKFEDLEFIIRFTIGEHELRKICKM